MAGGGPLGAMYEIGVLMALDEALVGLDLNDMDIYVGVSAGSFLTAGLANQLTPTEIYRLFIDNDKRAAKSGSLKPELFLEPATSEYGRRLKSLPGLAMSGLMRRIASPFRRTTMEAFAPITRAIPAGVFDNEGLSRYLAAAFNAPGRTNDFRQLRHTLYSVAVDLDTGKAVTFGGPGQDHVPISKAVQASAALPGLFPPVEIEGHYYVDGALKKTLNASLALEDGAQLVIGVNPLVPYDADAANRRLGKLGKAQLGKLVDGGLPVVLSQTFRTLIHSRMHAGLEKYAAKYKNASIVLFEPGTDDPEMFFTNLFSYASRKRVCEHAYQRTRADLLKRRHELEPVFAKFGISLDIDALKDEKRTLDRLAFKQGRPTRDQRLNDATIDLADAMTDLENWVARAKAA
jgi:predicted acylesterase/phospholipase RssA